MSAITTCFPPSSELTLHTLPSGLVMIHDAQGEYDGPYRIRDAMGVISDIKAEEELAAEAETAQVALDEHNAAYDQWQRMTPEQRDAAIKFAMR